MNTLDTRMRLVALEAVVARLLLAEARQAPDPAGMLDGFAGQMRRLADGIPLAPGDDEQGRMQLAAALLNLVTLAKEQLLAEQFPGG
jgi:hypothetical protein